MERIILFISLFGIFLFFLFEGEDEFDYRNNNKERFWLNDLSFCLSMLQDIQNTRWIIQNACSKKHEWLAKNVEGKGEYKLPQRFTKA